MSDVVAWLPSAYPLGVVDDGRNWSAEDYQGQNGLNWLTAASDTMALDDDKEANALGRAKALARLLGVENYDDN